MKFIDFFAEEWRDVVGFEGIYQVSNYGRVKSLPRVVRKGGKTGEVLTKEMQLTPRQDQNGYTRVYLNENGRTRFMPVHRLVAKAFIPNPDNKPQVNHIDGNKSNNCVSNLEWCTNSENQKHAYRIGLNRVTGRAGRPKVGVKRIDPSTSEVLDTYESINSAARKTGICAPNIRKVIVGERTHAGGYRWEVV